MKNSVRAFCFIALVLLSIGLVSAIDDSTIYSINANYIINMNDTVSKHIEFIFSTALNDSVTYNIENNITDLIVSDGDKQLNYTLTEVEKGYLMNVSSDEPITKLIINYTSMNSIFQKDSVKLFLTGFNFDSVINKIKVRIDLPPGDFIHNNEYAPEDATISSDGGNIALTWDESNVLKTSTYSVNYYDMSPQITPDNSTNISRIPEVIILPGISQKNLFSILIGLIIGLPAVIIAGSLIIIIVVIINLRTKINEGLLKGFMEDEQKVILYMQKHKEAWQNKIRHEFGFSRAKSTRIIKKLQEKELVKKEEYGKTNKIFWIKK